MKWSADSGRESRDGLYFGGLRLKKYLGRNISMQIHLWVFEILTG
jgi:hypothetical protein